MANYNYKVDDHPILGIFIGFIPIIIYEMFHFKTNIWLESNGLTAVFIYGTTGIFMLLVCIYSASKLWKGNRSLNYQLPFYALIILTFIVADMKKVGRRTENSPVVFYASQSSDYGQGYLKSIEITFRENGTCRFTQEPRTFSEMYFETRYTRNGKEFNIEIPKDMTGSMPSVLTLKDGMLIGEIHYNHSYVGTKVYYRVSKDNTNASSIFDKEMNRIEVR